MFKVENGVVQAISSSPMAFDNMPQVQRAEQLKNIPIKEFPSSGFM
jgi:hypothetical protein